LFHERITHGVMKKVLIAEGDETLRKIMEITLMNEDFSVLFAVSGQQVIDLAQSEIPDLIVAESRHPMMNGPELIEKLKALDGTAHIPVMLVMAAEEEGERQDHSQGYSRGCLLKPFTPMKFLAYISLALKKSNNNSPGDMHDSSEPDESPVESQEPDEGTRDENTPDSIFPDDSGSKTLHFESPLPGKDNE
jgi:CheY-like chemotaxis protein